MTENMTLKQRFNAYTTFALRRKVVEIDAP